jgi:hypothetical protein
MASRKYASRKPPSAVTSPCASTFSQTTEEPGLATGNVPAARLTQPDKWLKWPARRGDSRIVSRIHRVRQIS